MKQPIRTLTRDNITRITDEFRRSVGDIGASIAGKTGFPLLFSLKRQRVRAGPYPDVTLFEAANRIMSDLVILHGIALLLREKRYPFDEYTVEFGNEDNNGFDIRATSSRETLVGEAFNVAPSFFQFKKGGAIRKLRTLGSQATYRIIVFNSDAISASYVSRDKDIQHIVVESPAAYLDD